MICLGDEVPYRRKVNEKRVIYRKAMFVVSASIATV